MSTSGTPHVVVVGSANLDVRLDVAALPAPGETVLARSSGRGVGGKGANQAVAAARAGAGTALIGSVGRDDAGDRIRGELRAAGVHVATLRAAAAPTGLAVVTVACEGENLIVVDPGSNATVTQLSAAERVLVSRARVLLLQLEIPIAGVLDAALAAHGRGCRVVLNAAPAAVLPERLWAAIDLLVVNEHEAATLTGTTAESNELTGRLLERVPEVIVTLGSRGSRYAAHGGRPLHVPAPQVSTVDTTAAGDTYCGVLAAGLAAGASVPDAMVRASAAASLTVQRRGAIDSIPTSLDIDVAVRASHPSYNEKARTNHK
jgi:ribokinase